TTSTLSITDPATPQIYPLSLHDALPLPSSTHSPRSWPAKSWTIRGQSFHVQVDGSNGLAFSSSGSGGFACSSSILSSTKTAVCTSGLLLPSALVVTGSHETVTMASGWVCAGSM